MNIRQRVLLPILLIFSHCFVAIATAAEPVSLEELKQMAGERAAAAEILEAARTRGLGFDWSLLRERQLRRAGLSRQLVDQLKQLDTAAPIAADPQLAEEPAAAKLDPALEREYEQFDERLDRILKNSNTSLVKIRSDHITVVCEKELAERFLADVKKLEKLLAAKFPAPLGTGPDARKAVIVLTRTRYDYQNFMESMFREYEADGRKFASPDAQKTALQASNVVLDGLAVSCLEDAAEDAARHQVAYGVGYHYMDQLTRGNAPVALVAGFGNFTETALMGGPTVRLTGGYNPRDLDNPQRRWPILARKKLADGKVSSLRRVINYDLGDMQTEDYAVCWSFVSLLATGEKQMAALVASLRDGGDPAEQILKLYDINEQAFLAGWKKFAAQQR